MGWIPQISRRFRNVTQFSRVPLGGGGFVTEMRISDDGLTRIIKTDVSIGAYIWKNPDDLTATDATGSHADFQWYPLVTETSLAGDSIFIPGNYGHGFACHDALFAPSDPTLIYYLGPGLSGADNYLFKSTDRGLTFTRKAFAGDSLGPQEDNTRMWGPKAAVDPNDADNVLWGTLAWADAGKIYRTTDGGETAALTSFPASGTVAGAYPTAIAFSPVTSGLVYAFRYGTGLYKSTNSGTDWTQVTGGPTTCTRMHVDQFGQVWITELNVTAGLHRLEDDGSTWTAVTGAAGFSWRAVATNPLSASKAANQVSVISDGGGLNTSYNNGTDWTGTYGSSPLRVATDITWLADTNENYMTAGNLVYDTQSVSGFARGRLWFVQGIGAWYGHPLTDNAQPTWTELTRGNDELIPEQVFKLPGASRKCIIGCHDRGAFALDGVNYPAAQLYDNSVNLRHVFGGADWAGQAPDEFAINFTAHQNDPAPLTQQLFVSTDGGATGAVTAEHPYVGTDYESANVSSRGSVGVSASGVANMVIAGSGGATPRYTIDSGATWSDCTMSGATYVGTSVTRMTGNKNTAGVFYLFDTVETTGGFWRSTDNGETFTRLKTWAQLPPGSGTNGSLISVPGQGDDLFISFGWGSPVGGSAWTGSGSHPLNPSGTTLDTMLRFSHDGGSSWTDMSDNWLECHSVGVGKEKPGSSYPTVFVTGQKVGDTKQGVYRSTDFDPLDPAAATFDLLPGPYGTYDSMRFVAGDMEVYGDVWIGLGATGLIKGRLV
jgi:xyloglucan-specific exo-beta-1,4-glucanase